MKNDSDRLVRYAVLIDAAILLILLALLVSGGPPALTRALSLTGIVLVAMLSVLTYISTHRRRENDEQVDEIAGQMFNAQARMLSLQSQINPHFLYNTLESIRSKAVIHDEHEIAAMTEALAHLFRYSIGRGEVSASIASELNNVRDYLTIQNYRFRNRFLLIVEMEEIEPLLETVKLPVLTLQPLVENAVHHGLEKRAGPGTVTIRALLTDAHLILEILDDGVGMSEETLETLRARLRNPNKALSTQPANTHGSGIALSNVDQRIKLYFGSEYGLEIMSVENLGTRVNLVLPAP